MKNSFNNRLNPRTIKFQGFYYSKKVLILFQFLSINKIARFVLFLLYKLKNMNWKQSFKKGKEIILSR